MKRKEDEFIGEKKGSEEKLREGSPLLKKEGGRSIEGIRREGGERKGKI